MSIKYAILGLLQYKDMHGYRIKSHIERNFGHMWSINYGQIYPNLKRMEEEGLVTKREITQINAPDRKLYSITEKGKETFTEWLKSPPERGAILRDPFLLKFVFFGFGDRERSLEIIDEEIESYKKQMEKRRRNVVRWKDHDVYVRLMTELGLSLNDVILNWLHRAKKEIGESPEEDFTTKIANIFGD